ncbi:MAG: flagellar basal body-associated FliL family protein [Pseudomonadota bacterium]
MSDAATDPEAGDEAPKKGGLKPLLIGLVLAVAGGAGGFFAGSSGILGGDAPQEETKKEGAIKDTVFVAVDPLVISIVRPDRVAQLRLQLSLEVESPYASEVEALKPRLMDVLNSYLRAVDTAEFDGSGALVRLRAQMLRRVQIVVGNDAVHDLLVQEFVVN